LEKILQYLLYAEGKIWKVLNAEKKTSLTVLVMQIGENEDCKSKHDKQ